jgi:hypothetical protein
MNMIKNSIISAYETVAWFIKNKVVWHSYFERIIVRDFRLVRQEATMDVTSGRISWTDSEKNH